MNPAAPVTRMRTLTPSHPRSPALAPAGARLRAPARTPLQPRATLEVKCPVPPRVDYAAYYLRGVAPEADTAPETPSSRLAALALDRIRRPERSRAPAQTGWLAHC